MRWSVRCSLFAMVALAGGCVERRFTVVSNPPGAMVLVDRQEVGAAPVTLPSRASTYYGDREFLLIKDGYEPLLVKQPVPAPWYGYFPLDFFAENVWPGTILDHRVFTYQMAPLRVVPAETLLQSANASRGRAMGIGTPGQMPLAEPPAGTVIPGSANPATPSAAPAVAPGATGSTTANPTRVDFD